MTESVSSFVSRTLALGARARARGVVPCCWVLTALTYTHIICCAACCVAAVEFEEFGALWAHLGGEAAIEHTHHEQVEGGARGAAAEFDRFDINADGVLSGSGASGAAIALPSSHDGDSTLVCALCGMAGAEIQRFMKAKGFRVTDAYLLDLIDSFGEEDGDFISRRGFAELCEHLGV
jgi:hypothetical protein